MPIYRNPVPGASLPRPLPCVGDECINLRLSLALGKKFECPNHEKAHQGGCQTRAFLYPRQKRKSGTFHFHQGIDIGETLGETIISVTNGVVTQAVDEYTPGFGGYGKVVVVEGEDGLFYFYAHCQELLVKVGDAVQEQMPIAKVGDTAYDKDDHDAHLTGSRPHLHFEVSRESYPRKNDNERSPEGAHVEVRENPLDVLESLGPWGVGKNFFLPTGPRASGRNLEQLFQHVEKQSKGGYFPLGANNFWHGGVHLFMAPSSVITAPFSGRIVAARLDEDNAFAYRDFGSTNFILMRHDLPEAVTDRFENNPPPAPSGQTKSDQQSENKPAARKKRESVGRGGTNPKADVQEAARMLRGTTRPSVASDDPGAAESASPRFFYEHSSDPESGDEPVFVAAIEDFQNRIISTQRLRWKADGLMVVGGTTWRELKKVAPPPPEPDAKDESANTGKEGQAATSPPSGTRVYSLFMHLEATKLDAECAKRIPWLARVKTPETPEEKQRREEAEASQRDADAKASADQAKRDEEDRAEAGEYSLGSTVGIRTVGRRQVTMVNALADVLWVKKRLARFGYYEGSVEDASADESFAKAIGVFQSKHVDGYRGAKNPPNYINPGAKTEKTLKRTRSELGLDGKKKASRQATQELRIDESFAARLRERDRVYTAEVVSGLDIPVSGGEPLWTVGYGSAAAQDAPESLVHWGVFSEEALFADWERLEDPNDDLTIDACEQLIAFAEDHEGVRGMGDGVLSKEEVAAFYGSADARFLRNTQCRFRSEWGADLDAVAETLDRLRIEMIPDVRTVFHPYTWWSDAADVLPGSPHVWHYNPIAFLEEYARACGALTGDLMVEVYVEKRRACGVRVSLSRDGVLVRPPVETSSTGVVKFHGLEPGVYAVEAQSSEVADAEMVKVVPGTVRTAKLGDPPVAPGGSGDNPFVADRTTPLLLTRLREGDSPRTLSPHPPPSQNSGVTVGYGYDVCMKSAETIRADFAGCSIEARYAESLIPAIGKRGSEAKQWLSQNAATTAWQLSEEQRTQLLQRIWPTYEQRAKAVATKSIPDTPGAVTISEARWSELDAYTKELLTDLIYVGAPYRYHQDAVNRILADERLDEAGRLRKLRAFVETLPPKHQKEAGKKKRLQWIDAQLQLLEDEP